MYLAVFADGNFISNNDFCYKEYVEENNNYLYRKKNKEAFASLFFYFLLPITLSIKPKA